jgi:anti-sigma factor RsiW
MANCLDDNDMACYFDGLLPEDEVAQLEEHFVGCERCREVVVITRQIMSQESNFLDNDQGSVNIKSTIRCVPCLKGEVPDVKKVKPSLQASLPSEGFLFY